MRILFQSANQLKYREEMLWLGTTTLATVIIWIMYAVYVAYNTPNIDENVQGLLQPLNPTLNQQTLQGLNERYTPQEPYTILVIQEDGARSRTIASPAGTAETQAQPASSETDTETTENTQVLDTTPALP